MSEKCMRCGEVGEDRRTLWMACFYEMEELGIPFEKAEKYHISESDLEPIKPSSFLMHKYETKGTVGVHPLQFYTLRVCKVCRAEWMQAIKDWFTNKPNRQEEYCADCRRNPADDIYVRRNGVVLNLCTKCYNNRE